MNVLFLDDNYGRIREFQQLVTQKNWTVTVVNDAQPCITAMSENEYDIVFLDHDLEGRVYVPTYELNTGSEVARWIASDACRMKHDTKIIIHTLNEKGMEYMKALIESKGYECFYFPAIWQAGFFTIYAIEQNWLNS